MPAQSRARAEVYRWSLFAATELEQPLWRIARHTTLYPEHERLPADVALAQRDFRQMAAVLESHMAHRPFVAGEGVTAADFIVAYTLDWAGVANLLGGYEALRAYLERMYARPRAPRRIADILQSMRA
jgi:glutathione S-transferase